MADIKATQTAIESNTSGLAQGVQVDTSAQREINARQSQMAQSLIKGGASALATSQLVDEKNRAEQFTQDFLTDQAETGTQEDLDELSYQRSLFEEARAAGEIPDDDPVLAQVRSEFDALTKKRGQLPSTQFNIAMEAARQQAATQHPWLEREIDSLYGRVSGRNAAVLKLLDSQRATEQDLEKKIQAFDIQYMKDNNLVVTKDPYQNRFAVQAHQTKVARSQAMIARGEQDLGYAGFVDDRESNLLNAHKELNTASMAALDDRGRPLGTAEVGEMLDNLDIVANEYKAKMRRMYGTEVGDVNYETFEKSIDIMKENIENRFTGKTTKEVYDAQVALTNSAADYALQSQVEAIVGLSAITRAIGDDNIFSALFVNAANKDGKFTEQLLNQVTNFNLGNVKTAHSYTTSLPPAAHKRVSQALGALGKSAVNSEGELTTEAVETVSKTINGLGEIVSTTDYTADDFYAVTEPLIQKNFLTEQGGLVIDTITLNKAMEKGTNDAFTSLRDTLVDTMQKSGLGNRGFAKEDFSHFVQLSKNVDGSLQLSTRNLEEIDQFYGPAQGQFVKKEIQQNVDKLNRAEIAMINRGMTAHAHLAGGYNVNLSVEAQLAQFGIPDIIPMRDFYDESFDDAVHMGPPEAPIGLPVDLGDSRKAPTPAEEAALEGQVTAVGDIVSGINTGRAAGRRDTPEAMPFPSAGGELDVDELRRMSQQPTGTQFNQDVHKWWLDNYNADKKNRDSVSRSSERNIKQVFTNPTTKQRDNLLEARVIVQEALPAFEGEMARFGVTEQELQDFVAHTYAAETKAGTSRSQISKTGAAGAMQILPSTAMSLLGKSGTGSIAIFGPKAIADTGFDVEAFVQADRKTQQQMLIANKKANFYFALAKYFERKFVGK